MVSGERARTSRAARSGDSALHTLVRGAVRLANALEADDDTACMRGDELWEAALAFARSLSAADRERLGR